MRKKRLDDELRDLWTKEIGADHIEEIESVLTDIAEEKVPVSVKYSIHHKLRAVDKPARSTWQRFILVPALSFAAAAVFLVLRYNQAPQPNTIDSTLFIQSDDIQFALNGDTIDDDPLSDMEDII